MGLTNDISTKKDIKCPSCSRSLRYDTDLPFLGNTIVFQSKDMGDRGHNWSVGDRVEINDGGLVFTSDNDTTWNGFHICPHCNKGVYCEIMIKKGIIVKTSRKKLQLKQNPIMGGRSMGTDTRIWVHKDDLKQLELSEALFIYKNFTGRWEHCIRNKFQIEGNETNLENIKASLQNHSNIPQEARDLIRRLAGLRIIFQADFEDKGPEDYLELSYYLRKGWENIRGEIK